MLCCDFLALAVVAVVMVVRSTFFAPAEVDHVAISAAVLIESMLLGVFLAIVSRTERGAYASELRCIAGFVTDFVLGRAIFGSRIVELDQGWIKRL